MPRKGAVYGKRSGTSYFSNDFINFSPARSYKQPTHIRFDRTPSPPSDRQAAAVTSLETALEQLNVAADDEDAAQGDYVRSRGKSVTSIETAIEQLDGVADAKDVGCTTTPKGILQPRSINSLQKPIGSKATERTPDKKTVTRSCQQSKTSSPAPRPIRTRRNASSPKVQPCQSAIASETLISHTQPLLDVCATVDSAPATILNFQTWAKKASKRFTITKIAEASYGEVYRLSSTSSKTESSESVFKIIPLQPPPLPSGQKPRGKKRNTAFMSTISSVTSELSLLRRMSPIPGFTSFRGASVMRGPLPPSFTSAWRAYKQLQEEGLKKIVDGGSMFPDPTRRGAYSPDQLWAVIEMQDAGTDLETRVLEGAGEVWDVFWGVACALAKGEEGVRFEVTSCPLEFKACEEERVTDNGASIAIYTSGIFAFNPANRWSRKESLQGRKLGASGLETTIIDYTLSRADLKDSTPGAFDAKGAKDVAFYDLEHDPALFEGDATVDYQYEIYRLYESSPLSVTEFIRAYANTALAAYSMRTEIFGSSGSENTTKDESRALDPENIGWHAHHPRTNVLWLHYILSSLLNRTFSFFTAPTLDTSIECELRERLHLLERLLNPETVCVDLKNGRREFKSTSAVVGYAVEKGWLDTEDVVGL
ncbi:MAG: hypothetical protein M1836_003437 [Candelina mexicana]|nr:MAG: hypothetical protein M1836_003437 [Candelina mexicana]